MAKNQKRIRIEVVPARVWNWVLRRVGSGWLIRCEGANASHSHSKRCAVWTARLIAERVVFDGGTAELFIKNRAGRIVDRRTYPRSSDPRRSKG